MRPSGLEVRDGVVDQETNSKPPNSTDRLGARVSIPKPGCQLRSMSWARPAQIPVSPIGYMIQFDSALHPFELLCSSRKW
jgi:hypothetical protein